MDFAKEDVRDKIVRITSNTDKTVYTFKNQSYDALKREYLRTGRLFEDPLFPATDKSMFYTQPVPTGAKWRRPKEISTKPQFIVDEATTNDLDQGYLGNCWFVAGCAGIVLIPELFNNVCPANQVMEGPEYAGIFRFRFWYYGQWVEVVVDDRLPVYSTNKLIFCNNREDPNEFWSALLEKAYAKLCGCYENLDGGSTTEALIDMSGGIEETFEIKNMRALAQKEEIWQIMIKSRQHKSLIGSSIAPNPRIREARLTNGLVMGHAYTVTKVACLEIGTREVRLVRCRNPWGNEVEWKGAWSDNSYEWNSVSSDVKQALKYKNLADGEFWMSFDDFYRNFETVQFCELTPDAFSTELLKKQNAVKAPRLVWKLTAYNGKWVPGVSSGGSGRRNEALYWTNPQFLITVKDVDPDDNENMATMIIALMQKYTREKRTANRGQSAEDYIQFRLYRILNEKDVQYAKSTGKCLSAAQLERCGTSGPYINTREVTKRFRVQPGSFLIIPSCYDENVSGEFLVRVYTENPVSESDCTILHDHSRDSVYGENCKKTDLFFSSPKSVESEFSNWANLINGSDSRISNDFTKSSLTMTNTTDMNTLNQSRFRPKTSSPVYSSKLYINHQIASVYDRIDSRTLKRKVNSFYPLTH